MWLQIWKRVYRDSTAHEVVLEDEQSVVQRRPEERARVPVRKIIRSTAVSDPFESR
jgi:hypothetical protein